MSRGGRLRKSAEVRRAGRLRDAGHYLGSRSGCCVAFAGGVAAGGLSVGAPRRDLRALAREWARGRTILARASRRIPWSRSGASEVSRGV